MIFRAQGDDPMQIINESSESEYDSKWSNGASETIDQYELEVFTEIFLLQVIATREDHWWKQTVEKDLFVEVHLRDIVEVVEKPSEDEAD